MINMARKHKTLFGLFVLLPFVLWFAFSGIHEHLSAGTENTYEELKVFSDVLDIILSEGLEHHMSLTYGDHTPALLALAKMLKIPVLRL